MVEVTQVSYSVNKADIYMRWSCEDKRYEVRLFQVESNNEETLLQTEVISRGNKLTVAMNAPGRTYKVIFISYPYNVNVPETLGLGIVVRAEYSKAQLDMLLNLALQAVMKRPLLDPCYWLYRNKPWAYFKSVCTKHNGIEHKYTKDNNGDPASCINGRLCGLFFSACVNRNPWSPGYGQPCEGSPFGDTRLLIPVAYFFDNNSCLYFADFYCMTGYKAHWVTLVHTRKGSDADKFCAQKLIALNIADNPFLCGQPQSMCWVTSSGIWVEMLHTEDIDHNRLWAIGASLQWTGGSNRRHGGRKKTANCRVCNVQPELLEAAQMSEAVDIKLNI